jgi:aminomethyltransferase
MMKETALYGIHKALGARMISFAGFNMPVEYSGIIDEHLTVRNAVGIFDVSHMGEFRVRGVSAFDFLQRVTTNDLNKLYDGKVQYTCFPNGEGGIVDDLLVYRMKQNEYMLVVNAANIDKDWNWLQSQNKEEANLENVSASVSLLAVQGPEAVNALQKLTPVSLKDIAYYSFVTGQFAGIDNMIISATGYTGSGGFELYVDNKDAVTIWEKVIDAGKEFGIKPAGLATRDTLRLEMGYCLYGNDIDDTTSPIEAGLGWITKFTDGNDFIDRDYLWKQKQEGVSKKLTGFEMVEKSIPRQHYKILDDRGHSIGEVTSGTMYPMLKKGIGMGYIKTGMTDPGQSVWIEIRNKILKAQVVKIPFYKK